MKGHSSKNGIAHSFREPKDSLHSLLLVPHNAVMFGGIIIPYTTAGKHTGLKPAFGVLSWGECCIGHVLLRKTASWNQVSMP